MEKEWSDWKDAKERFKSLSSKLSSRMDEILAEKMKKSDIVDLERRQDMPEHLIRATVRKGNARGARKFVLKDVPKISFNENHPTLSEWSVYAVPVSEKTGREMSEEVLLCGTLVFDNPHEMVEETERRMLSLLVSGHSPAVRSRRM